MALFVCGKGGEGRSGRSEGKGLERSPRGQGLCDGGNSTGSQGQERDDYGENGADVGAARE